VRKDSRSMMNVPFRLGSEELEKKFVAEAKAAEMIGLKGHRSVGGIRASIYNAVPLETVQALVDFMADFEKRNG
jgi:phosphoserine aminotransferase